MVGELGEMIRGGLSDEAAVLAGNMPRWQARSEPLDGPSERERSAPLAHALLCELRPENRIGPCSCGGRYRFERNDSVEPSQGMRGSDGRLVAAAQLEVIGVGGREGQEVSSRPVTVTYPCAEGSPRLNSSAHSSTVTTAL